MFNLKAELLNIDINISDENVCKFNKYYEFLVETNKHLNLTAITEYEDVMIKHFYDSILLAKTIDITKINSFLDIGSGAGFPAVPLAILYPNVKFTLIDALNKRITFLNNLIKLLDLKNVVAIHSRAEDFAKDNRESFDVVSARAVARLNILAELALPLCKVGGYFIALKGKDEEEIKSGLKAINILGADFFKAYEFNLPLAKGERNILVYKKTKKTDLKYPRLFSKIKEKPLG